jgi:hypothetical protein
MNKLSSVIPLHDPADANGLAPAGLSSVRGQLVEIGDDGQLVVVLPGGQQIACDWLEQSGIGRAALQRGDAVLAMVDASLARGIVVGRIGPYRTPATEPKLMLEATESVVLKCGESSVDLRADGKVTVRGDDVLLRAKGTQRIKAGTVSIN